MNEHRTIRIGTRGSALALWQAEWIEKKIRSAFPRVDVKRMIIKTTGDIQTSSSAALNDLRGVFTKELDNALLDGSIDLAVHSLKDLPTEPVKGIAVSVISERAPWEDVLIAEPGDSIESLLPGAVIGTGSPRRRAQIMAIRNDISIKDIRGNVETRIRKWQEGQYSGLIMAHAGLHRLQLDRHIAQILPGEIMLPAPGQGALGITILEENQCIQPCVSHIHHGPTADAVGAERACLRALGGGCRVPIAVLGQCVEETITVSGFVGDLSGEKFIRLTETGRRSDAEHVGEMLGKSLYESGGKEILDSIRNC